MSLLKPEVSISIALATGVLVWTIFQHATPPIIDQRVADAHDADADAAERLASWTAAGIVAGIALVAKDETIFVVGESMVMALAWWHRHANAVNPLTGKASAPNPVMAADAVSPDMTYAPST
jgi:hypothetical protein